MNGNPKAQETLFKKYKKSVRNFLRNKYSLYYDLDDDVSEIMIKVFMKLDTFDETKSKFRSWVFSIAKNHVIDKWRCGSCVTTVNVDNVTLTTTNGAYISSNSGSYITSNNPDIQLNSSYSVCNTDFENCSSITYVSEQLTPQDFTFLDMKYVQGYDYNEIGKEFNLTSSTISNRVNYIKTKLKKNNTEIIYE